MKICFYYFQSIYYLLVEKKNLFIVYIVHNRYGFSFWLWALKVGLLNVTICLIPKEKFHCYTCISLLVKLSLILMLVKRVMGSSVQQFTVPHKNLSLDIKVCGFVLLLLQLNLVVFVVVYILLFTCSLKCPGQYLCDYNHKGAAFYCYQLLIRQFMINGLLEFCMIQCKIMQPMWDSTPLTPRIFTGA